MLLAFWFNIVGITSRIQPHDHSCIFVSSERTILMCQLIPWAPRPCTITQLIRRHDSCMTQLLTRTQIEFCLSPLFVNLLRQLSTSKPLLLFRPGCCYLWPQTAHSLSTSAMGVSALGSHGLDTTRPCSSRRRRSRPVADSALLLIRHKHCNWFKA